MSEQLDTLSGLARILSSEPLPLCPMFRSMAAPRLPAEMEKWVGDLYNWLKKLFGKFTAENIITTINQGGTSGLGFQKVIERTFHYNGNNDVTVVLDNLLDWRKVGAIVYSMRTTFTLGGNDLTDIPVPDATTELFVTTVDSGSYPLAVQTGPGNNALIITSTGELQFLIDNTVGSIEFSTYIFVGALGYVPNAKITNLGNGL